MATYLASLNEYDSSTDTYYIDLNDQTSNSTYDVVLNFAENQFSIQCFDPARSNEYVTSSKLLAALCENLHRVIAADDEFEPSSLADFSFEFERDPLATF